MVLYPYIIVIMMTVCVKESIQSLTGNCPGTFDGDTATIKSLTFENNDYPENTACVWHIGIPETLKYINNGRQKTSVHIVLAFSVYDIGLTGCNNTGDNLLITTRVGNPEPICKDNKDGKDGRSNLVYEYDVTINPIDDIVITFNSDKNDNGEKGFSFTYRFPCEKCDQGTCGKNTAYACRCNEGFQGQYCNDSIHIPVNRCDPNPCKYGTCAHDSSSENLFRCTCTKGYTGTTCNMTIDACASSPCQHNGKCNRTATIKGYTCDCVNGYKGQICDEIDNCFSMPCINNGTCKDTKNKFKCECPEPFGGETCQNMDYCYSKPCRNNGKCTSLSTRFDCDCLKGYEGETCNQIDHCYHKPCKNGGRCEQSENGEVNCHCTSHYRGLTCNETNDGTYCPEEVDPYEGSEIKWVETKMGKTDSQDCPEAEGKALRKCLIDHRNGIETANWSQPDLVRCVSPQFREIMSRTKRLRKTDVVHVNDILDVTSSLSKAIENNASKRIYAGDLAVATSAVNIVANVIKKLEPTTSDIFNITEGYGEAVTKIIDPTQSFVWRFTHQGYLENRLTSLMSSVEVFSASIADHTSKILVTERYRRSNDASQQSALQHVSVLSKNLDFSIKILDRGQSFNETNYGGDSSDNSIHLPNDVLKRAIRGTSDPYIHVYFARFPTISELLTNTNDKIREFSEHDNVTSTLNSPVISSKVLNVREEDFQDLDETIKITFKLQDPNLSNTLEQTCVFLNMSATSQMYRWNREGCVRSREESNASYTVCYCNHLTNFAVIMDVYGIKDEIDPYNSRILTYLSYGGGALSILGCLISIITFEFFRLKNERIRIHEQLALTIILVQLFFLIGIDRTENGSVCKAMAVCLHYFLLAMFCWMLVEGVHLYLVLVKVFRAKSHMKKYIAIGWGVPMVIVGISAGVFHSQYGVGNICWLTQEVLLVAFVPAVGLVIVINSVVLMVVMRIMLKSRSKGSKYTTEERSSVKLGLKAASVLLPLLGLTWTFGFLSITSQETLVFTYLFTLFNSLQGVFFFVFHCLLSGDVQNAFERRNRRQSQLKMTESSISKRERRDSENNSSMYSKHSIKTASTGINSTLDRTSQHVATDVIGDTRHQSVTFDDDVFFQPPTPYQGSVSSNLSRNSYTNVLMNPVHPDHLGSSRTDLFINNISRRTNRSGSGSGLDDGYVLYYGKSNQNARDIDVYSSLDKNQLYASVTK